MSRLIRLVIDRPWIALPFGALVAVFGVVFGWVCYQDLRAFGAGPAPAEMARLPVDSPPAGGYLRVEGATLRCDQAHQYGNNTYVPLAGGPPDRIVVATFSTGSADRGCADPATRPLVGVLDTMPPRLQRHLIEEGMGGLDGPGPVLDLCTYCGPDNSRTGVWLCAAMIVIGLGLYPLARLARQRQDDAAA